MNFLMRKFPNLYHGIVRLTLKDYSTLNCSMLQAIVFLDRDIIWAHALVKVISVFANSLKSKEPTNRYFDVQFMARSACNGNMGILVSVSNPVASTRLPTLLGCVDFDMQDFSESVELFLRLCYLDQVALKRLFVVGATSRISTSVLVAWLNQFQVIQVLFS